MKNTIIGLLAIVVLGAGLFFGLSNKKQVNKLGSVNVGSDYSSVLLDGSLATSTTAISSIGGALGSIIVTEDQAIEVDVYDATSTAAIGNGLSTKIAVMEATQAEGTYTFDAWLQYGLVLDSADWTAFDGTWTITYR